MRIGDVLDLEVSEHLRDVLRHGRETAVDHQRDSTWAAALLPREDRAGLRVAEHAPRDVLVEHLRRMSARQLLLVDDIAALPAPWPADIARKVLTVLYTAAAPTSHSFRALTDLLARHAPFELVDLFDDAATRTDDLVRLNRFATAADDERADLASELRSRGVDHLVLSTAGDWLRPLANFLRLRRGRR